MGKKQGRVSWDRDVKAPSSFKILRPELTQLDVEKILDESTSNNVR